MQTTYTEEGNEAGNGVVHGRGRLSFRGDDDGDGHGDGCMQLGSERERRGERRE